MTLGAFSELFYGPITFMLIHSLWQSLLIFLLLKALHAFIPGQLSNSRYAVSVAAMICVVLSALATFIHYFSSWDLHTSTMTQQQNAFVHYTNVISRESHNLDIGGFIASHTVYIFWGWFAGTCVFLARIGGGWWYLQKLRSSTRIVNNDVAKRVVEISRDLKIKVNVQLAESSRVLSPIVIGFTKPLILFPAGLIAGLPTEQLEAILIHELVHIKRNDFVLNLMQSLLEAVFFYNPFFWLISASIRAEREHCCDDAVVKNGASAKAYVHALASLEQMKLTQRGMAVALAGNKNLLLQRIKRLMEKSVKNYSYRDRLVPIVLLLLGLVCASWFSIQKGDPSPGNRLDELNVAQADTTIKKKMKTAKYSKQKKVTVSPDGKPHEEIVESFEGDEDLKPMMEDFGFIPGPFAGTDGFEGMVPPVIFPPFENFEAIFPGVPSLEFGPDTIPPLGSRHKDWEKFQEEFQAKFQERFKDFYNKNEAEISEMMKDLEKNFEKQRWHYSDGLEDAMQAQARAFEEHARHLERQTESLHQNLEHLNGMEHRMHDWEKDHREHMKELEESMKEFELQMKSFEHELKHELVEDGYLKSADEIKSIEWNDDGDIKVNGEKIKESDREKYEELHRKHFGEKAGKFHYAE